MQEPTFVAPRESSGVRWMVGTPVVLSSGPLAGIRGVLVGLRGHQHCLIELDRGTKGVVVLVDQLSVELTTLSTDQLSSRRAEANR